MVRDELLNMANYLVFPKCNRYYREDYFDYLRDKPNLYLPICKNEIVLYDKLKGNEHHYTTDYTIRFVLPYIDKLLNFGFDLNDFQIKEFYYKDDGGIKYDMSYLVPNKHYTFSLYSLTRNKCFLFEYDGCDGLVFNKMNKDPYRGLFVLPHQCSIITNNELKSNRILFLSGDSQIIPSIAPLCCYFKKVYYFDNRSGKEGNDMVVDKIVSYRSFYEDELITDVLVQMYSNPVDWYIDINFM